MIKYLTIITLLIWPFGQLLSFSLLGLPFSLNLLDAFTLALFLLLLIHPKRKIILNTPLTKPLVVFLLSASLSLIVNVKFSQTVGLSLSLLYLLRLFIYPSIYFAIRHIGFIKVKQVVLVSLGIFICLGLVQYLFFPDMRYLKNLGFDDHLYRLIGPLYDPNFTGSILAGLSILFIHKRYLFLSLLTTLMLALTFSRASYLAFVVGLIALLMKDRKKLLLVTLSLFCLAVLLSPKPFGEGVNLLRTFSISSRFSTWNTGFTLFTQRPLFGWGYNNLRGVEGSRFQIDNSYLFLLATTGIAGLISYLFLIFKLLESIRDKALNLMVWILLIHGFFNNTLFYAPVMLFIWLIAGIRTVKN